MPKSPPTTRRRTTIRIYRPDNRFKAGAFEALFALVAEVISYRSHIKMLFASDFKLSYNGTALGVIWNFLLPIVPITVYILLVNLRVLPRLEGIEPAVYISFNMTLWYLLTGFMRQPIDIVRSRNANAMRTAIPLSAAIASSFADLTFETLVRIAAVAVMMLAVTQLVSPMGAMALIAIFAGIVFCLGLGLGLSVLNAIYPDIQRIVSIVLQYGIFLSGVIFPVSTMPELAWLEFYNPLNVFIHAARDWFFVGQLNHPIPFAIWSAIGALLLLISSRFFYVMEHRLRGLS